MQFWDQDRLKKLRRHVRIQHLHPPEWEHMAGWRGIYWDGKPLPIGLPLLEAGRNYV